MEHVERRSLDDDEDDDGVEEGEEQREDDEPAVPERILDNDEHPVPHNAYPWDLGNSF